MLKFAEWFLCAIRFRRMRLAPVPVRRILLAAFALVTLAQCAQAQVPDAVLSSMGLQSMWRAQLEMPIEEGRIVSAQLWTNPSVRLTFVELTLPPGVGGATNRTLRISADRLDANGEPIGVEVAKQEVEAQARRLLGRATGIPAIEKTVPLVYLVVVTSDGYVQTYDAESGAKLWSNSTSSPRFPAAPASVSDLGVAVAQGPYLTLFDWKTGKELSKRQMKRATTAGVALIDNIAFVSSLSGQLMAFNLGEAPTLNNWSYQLYGRTVTTPATAHRPNKLVAFATENGLVTVFSAGEKIEPWFNFEARAPLAGPVSFHGNGLYCGDVSGQITKISLDRLGRIDWRLMLGDALGAPPVVIDQTVYLTNVIGHMIAADDETGVPLWASSTSRVRSILSATKDRLYCRSLTDRLLAVDAASGKIVAESAPSVIHTDLVNHLNDRVYLISKNGQITALRQQGVDHALPDFHEALPAPEEKPKAKPGEVQSPAAAETMEATTGAESSDPFGLTEPTTPEATTAPAAPPAAAEADPFAAPPTATPNANPFANPF